MLGFLAITLAAACAAIGGTAIMVNIVLREHQRDAEGERAARDDPRSIFTKVRERILLRWDTTRRLR